MSTFNRRDVLKAAAIAGAALALSPLSNLLAQTDTGPRKKLLFFTKSSGFQHSVITRKDPTKLAWAEQILTDLGAKNGFDVTCSKDGTIFKKLDDFDVIAFYTTEDLTQDSDKYAKKKDPDGKKDVEDRDHLLWKEPGMPAGAKDAFLDAIKNGKGFVGFHCASDTFHTPKGKGKMTRDVNDKGEDEFDPYIQMLGGEFIVHGKQQKATLKTIDDKFPGAAALNNASFVEEWYSLKNFSPDIHVILAQDCAGMEGPMYQRAPYPETWIRMHGKGRVFFTSLGHREDVWERPDFQALAIGGLNWTSGKIEADVMPNIKQATPGADFNPPAPK